MTKKLRAFGSHQFSRGHSLLSLCYWEESDGCTRADKCYQKKLCRP